MASGVRTAIAVMVAALPLASAAFSATGITGAHAAAIGPPVCIPGEATVPLTADAKVSERHPGRHYGTASHWKVNYGPATLRSFLGFNLPAIPSGCSVKKATLEVTGTESGYPHPAEGWPGARVNVYLATGRWTERGITWKNQPAAYGCYGPSQVFATSGELLITAVIQDAYHCLDSGRLKQWNGLKLKGWSPTTRGRQPHWRFAVESRESAHPPMMHISWE